MMPCFVYSEKYDFPIPGVGKLHPFDARKYSKAWKLLADEIGDALQSLWIEPKEQIAEKLLLTIHHQEYLASLKSSRTIAKVIEVWPAKFIPNSVLQSRLLNPIRLAAAGTLIATQEALNNHSITMNFGGGYHHAFPDHGEGFSFYADAAIAIKQARELGLLAENDKVLMIDLDAHRGNGFDAITCDDPRVEMFDMYNFQVYPGHHGGDPDEFPYIVPIKYGSKDDFYLSILTDELPAFLNAFPETKLVIYNAGTDILDTDPLGGLKVSFQGVVERDRFVLDEISKRNLPSVIVTSGGYTAQSYKLVAELGKIVLDRAKK